MDDWYYLCCSGSVGYDHDQFEKYIELAKSKGYRCVKVEVRVVEDDN